MCIFSDESGMPMGFFLIWPMQNENGIFAYTQFLLCSG